MSLDPSCLQILFLFLVSLCECWQEQLLRGLLSESISLVGDSSPNALQEGAVVVEQGVEGFGVADRSAHQEKLRVCERLFEVCTHELVHERSHPKLRCGHGIFPIPGVDDSDD